jgi:high-affinity Fe2+/Pb2+ permease
MVLVVAGIGAHLVKKKEQWYPMWFGVYAGHMLWLIGQAFL